MSMKLDMLFGRVKDKLRRISNQIKVWLNRRKLMSSGVTLISQNCIGGVFYHDMGMRFDSPTIDLFFSGDDFVRFVLNLDYYIHQELNIKWTDTYPVGNLDDVTVHFMHYENCEDAQAKWNARKARIDWDHIVVLCTDMEGFAEDVQKKWDQISYPKVLFSAIHGEATDVVLFPKYARNGCVGDLIAHREFYKNGALMKMVNQYGRHNEPR